MVALVLLELTLREIVADIPHDLGALVAYSLLAAFVAFIAYGSRSPKTALGHGVVGADSENPND